MNKSKRWFVWYQGVTNKKCVCVCVCSTCVAHSVIRSCVSCVSCVFLWFTEDVPRMNISYKPQKISPKFHGTVQQLLHGKIRDSYVHPQFITDVIKPMQVDHIMDQEVLNLSGGELQRVALTIALGQVSVYVRAFMRCELQWYPLAVLYWLYTSKLNKDFNVWCVCV